MKKKTTDILSYCTILGWILAFLFGHREKSRFHLNQGLAVGLFYVIWQTIQILLMVYMPASVLNILFLMLSLFFLTAWVEGIAAAARGREKAIPIFGKLRLLRSECDICKPNIN